MLPAQNLRPESLLFVLATESRALNVVATSATTICFVSRNLIPKAKEIIKQKSHTPYYDKSNAKALLTSAYQKSFPYLPEDRKKAPFTQGSLLFVQTYLFANHHKVFVVLNLVLASTASVSTEAILILSICRRFARLDIFALQQIRYVFATLKLDMI